MTRHLIALTLIPVVLVLASCAGSQEVQPTRAPEPAAVGTTPAMPTRSDAAPTVTTAPEQLTPSAPLPSATPQAGSTTSISPEPTYTTRYMYDQQTLEYWRTRYPVSTPKIYDIFLDFLLPEQKRALANVDLRFPLVGDGPLSDDPFAFYSQTDPPTIIMPISSLNFLNDMSIALNWLELNGFSQQTLIDYVSMLKYNGPETFPGGHYPDPLAALQIPENALDDQAVDTFSLALFNSARAFILAHEMGHIYYDHPGYGPGVTREQSQANEIKADLFALELMRRIPEIPIGPTMFFTWQTRWEANRWDFPSQEAWEEYLRTGATHPLSSDRLRAIAGYVEESARDFAQNETDVNQGIELVKSLARDVNTLADLIDDPDLLQSIRIVGQSTDLESLAPQPANQVCTESTTRSADLPAFQGAYCGEYVLRVRTDQGVEVQRLEIQTIFQRTGDRVTGRFTFGLGDGALRGEVVDGALYFDWEWSGSNGRGVFQTTTDGESFGGPFGFGDARENAGVWSGDRR